ncbi:MAG: DUF1565 domain-containing protein [Mastigocoleus sp.]
MKIRTVFTKLFLTKPCRVWIISTLTLGNVFFISTPKNLADTLSSANPEIKANIETKSNPQTPTDPGVEKVEKIIYVNPQTGIDKPLTANSEAIAQGIPPQDSSQMPIVYQTISFAIAQATPGTIIQLAPGEYNAEKFPLVVKPGISLRGNESGKGKGVEIKGGGLYGNRVFARQNVGIIAQGNAKISGLTITNDNLGGIGIWIESGKPSILNNTFSGNKREGVFVTGKATPRIENNRFTKNHNSGVCITKKAGGEIRNNIFENTGFGISIGGNSTPVVSNNKIYSNRNGIVLTDFAKPQILLNNIENNSDYGVAILGQAEPDMQENTFVRNRKKDMFQSIPYSD